MLVLRSTMTFTGRKDSDGASTGGGYLEITLMLIKQVSLVARCLSFD